MRPFWTFTPVPGKFDCAAIIPDPLEFNAIARRGYVLIDGQVAEVVDPTDPALFHPEDGFIRFRFREPFKEAA